MKKKEVYYSVILLVLIIISFLFDVQIMKSIGKIRNGFFDYIFLSVSFASNGFIIFFFLTTLFLWKEKKARWIVPLWLSALFSAIASYLLKILVKRARPFQLGIISVLGILFYFMKNNFNTWNFSFPSFQAMFVFSALPILDKEFKKLKYVWFIFACFAAFSRVYFGLHYASDVLIGALAGYLIGYLMVVTEEKYELGKKVAKRIGLK